MKALALGFAFLAAQAHAAVPFEGSLAAQMRMGAAFRAGRLDEAVKEAKKALEAAEDELGPAHPALARPLEDLAALQRHRGEFMEAEQSYLRALSLRGRDPSRAQALRHLAALWMDLGNAVLAGEYLRQARGISPEGAAQKMPQQDPEAALHAAAVYESLGLLEWAARHFMSLKKYAQALELEKKILKINSGAHGEKHLRSGICLIRISEIYLLMDRPKEAKKAGAQGLAIAEKSLGADHPELKKIRLTLR